MKLKIYKWLSLERTKQYEGPKILLWFPWDPLTTFLEIIAISKSDLKFSTYFLESHGAIRLTQRTFMKTSKLALPILSIIC